MSRLDVNAIRHTAGSSDNISLDSSGRVLIGTTTVGHANADELTLENSSGAAGVTIRCAANFNSNIYFADPGSSTIGRIEYRHNGDTMRFYTFGSEVMQTTSTGELMFNSGYGSVATAYGVRAWINFAGDGSSIGSGRGSGNMDAVTDNGTGRYTMNFTNDMPDTNYSAYGSCAGDSSSTGDESKITFAHTSRAVGSIAVRVVDPVDDPLTVSIAIIR